MQKILSFLFLVISFSLSAQEEDPKEIEILGKLMYKLEKASWHSTDHFLANYPELLDSVSGYLSYENPEGGFNSIYFNKSVNKEIIATYQYSGLPHPDSAMVDTTKRAPTTLEADLIEIRTNALNRINENRDEFFSFYENTSLNLIPIIFKGKKSVYVLTGPQISGVLLLGNDYQLNYSNNNTFDSQEKLHNTMLQFETKAQDSTKQLLESYHSHVNTDYITPTDICTLLLYKEYLEWNKHYTISEKQVSIFDLQKERLFTITKEAWDKINESNKD